MRQVGTVKELWRYPVKGMAGERVEAGRLTAKGLSGDRVWALWDVKRQEIQSCKVRPRLLRCSARTRPGSDQVDVTLPDGEVMGSDDPAIHGVLSDLVGHESRLEPVPSADRLDFFKRYRPDDEGWLRELKATFEREDGEPLPDFFDEFPDEAKQFIARPGTFFLVTPLHLVTTATLAHLRSLNPQGDWDVRRFRANIVIQTPGDAAGLVEQDWVGSPMTVGSATVDCVMPTPRCGAVTRAQPDLGEDRSVLRTVVKEAQQNVGVYGEVVADGAIREGDAIALA